MFRYWPSILTVLALLYCNNNPYGRFPEGSVILTSMGDDPRTLDPVRVGDTTSNSIASNIHDTPYEYHYLKRPLELIPSMATGMPVRGRISLKGNSYYTFKFSIKKNLRYMDDTCFPEGRGREIRIDDIVLSIKRAADHTLDPFGFPLLTGKLAGFDEYVKLIESKRAGAKEKSAQLIPADLYSEDIFGVRKIDDYTLELLLTENYPQIIYFFALSISSPTPSECLSYYNGSNGRPSYDRHPVASGPFYLKEWHANYRIVLARNPNYRKDDFYPSEGNPGDEKEGLLELKGKPLPLSDEIRFQIIRTGPPNWSLFEQGYLDRTGIPSEVFNQVIQGQDLSEKYKQMGIRLDKEIDLASYWWYFNLKDPLFAKNPDLRRGLSLCLDRKEMIERFYNNRGIPAGSVVPPGIEGFFDDFKNPYSEYNIEKAKEILRRAGYPEGIDPKTKRSLRISLTLVASQGATSLYRFYIDQYKKCGIDLNIEQLDWPTVLERKYKKNFQMIHGGWHADYPDPQNFLQLLYGPNANGPYNENNYKNEEFDRLYEKIKNMDPGPERKKIIRRMNAIVAEDAPVIFLFHPMSFGLSHQWYASLKPHPINTNQLKYRSVDTKKRSEIVKKWNEPGLISYMVPVVFFGLIGVLVFITVFGYRRMER